mmetsp:Transcript_30529/g.69445  ORF Transcript_30529/g.69445 Transcript_30529/m.69445 type:complete len:577 (+) Transcript_30529:3-1733(+)
MGSRPSKKRGSATSADGAQPEEPVAANVEGPGPDAPRSAPATPTDQSHFEQKSAEQGSRKPRPTTTHQSWAPETSPDAMGDSRLEDTPGEGQDPLVSATVTPAGSPAKDPLIVTLDPPAAADATPDPVVEMPVTPVKEPEVDEAPACSPAPAEEQLGAESPKAEASPRVEPEADCGPEEDTVDGWMLPYDEVVPKVKAIFGNMIGGSLQSSKWDRRVEAMAAVETILKGYSLNPGSPDVPATPNRVRKRHMDSFKCCCALLYHALNDKILPIVFQAHSLYRACFESCETVMLQHELKAAMTILLTFVIRRLGDSNARLHESACSLVVFCAALPSCGLPMVLSGLREHGRIADPSADSKAPMQLSSGAVAAPGRIRPERIGRAVKRDLEGALTCLERLLDCHEVDGWDAEDVGPFFLAGLQCPEEKMRNRAIRVAVLLRRQVGHDSVMPMLSSLRQAQQDMIMKEFEVDEELGGAEDDSSGEELVLSAEQSMGLVVMGMGIKPGAAVQSSNGKFDDEDAFMDAILEDTDQVFAGAHNVVDDVSPHGRKRGPMLPEDEFEELLMDSHDSLYEITAGAH